MIKLKQSNSYLSFFKRFLNKYHIQVKYKSDRADLNLGFNKLTKNNIEFIKPSIGRTNAEQELLYLQQPEFPENPKILKVSVLGVPNSGKSTLVNRIMNRRITSVSSKMNTTRSRLTACLTDQNVQILFEDTPGLLPFKKKKRFNLDRQMIVDPHASLWESDLVCVVHDVSDEFLRDKLDKEVMKCLFAHPEKEAILILNKTDKLKNKKSLLDIIANLTGGCLNGKEFIQKEQKLFEVKKRKSFKEIDFSNLFDKTAKKLKLNLPSEIRSTSDKEVMKLLEELRICEDYLLKNIDNIKVDSNALKEDNDQEENKFVKIADKKTDLQQIEKNRMTLNKLKDDYIPKEYLLKNNLDVNSPVGLINTIANKEQDKSSSPILRSIADISPFDFKRDLLQTTDWHLYYQKLSSLSHLVRDRNHWQYFNQVFMISALQNDGVDDLKRYLFSRAKPGPWLFSRNMLTDQMPQDIAEMCVREKMLEYLPDEVPYELGLKVAYWEVNDNDCLDIVINIVPSEKKGLRKRQLSILLSEQANFVKLIARTSRQELLNTFQCDVKLKLIIEND